MKTWTRVRVAPSLTARQTALLLASCVLSRVVSLVRPCLSDDEAIYAVVAREMLAGRVLYRDIVDHKPPLIYLTYAVTQALAGPRGGMRLLHALTILVVFATALALARVSARVRRAGDGSAPFAAGLLYVLFTTTLLDFDALAANCELFMLLPLTLSVALYLKGVADGRRVPLLLCGLCLGVAVLYKYQAAVLCPLFAAHQWVVHRRRLAAAWWGGAALVVGLAAVLAAGAALMARSGSLAAAWFWFSFNFAYIKEGLNASEILRRAAVRVSFVVVSASFLWALGLREAVQVCRAQARAGADVAVGGAGGGAMFVVGWLGVSLLAVCVGGRFFGHYFHQATAPLSVLAAPGALRLWRGRHRRVALAWAGIPVVSFFVLGVFHGQVMAAAGEPDPDYAAMASTLAARSRLGEGLVIWGNSPVLYFEANRPLGTRFVFSNYLTGLSPATRTQSDPNSDASANVVPESWDMFEADLAARKPALFVDMSAGNVAGYGKFPPQRFPRLASILQRSYRLLDEMPAGGRLFRRRTDAE